MFEIDWFTRQLFQSRPRVPFSQPVQVEFCPAEKVYYRVGIFHHNYPSKTLSKRAYALKSITTEKHVGGDPFFHDDLK
jgi:hypothetical protein